jgi:hypothetical protein
MELMPPENRIRFFVFIVESPSAVDLYHRRSEGEIIRQGVALNQVPCLVKTAINLEAFMAALNVGLSEGMKEWPDRLPLLHISAHGDENGIQLSDGHRISWNELRECLKPINKALAGRLLVCMSCCQGYAGIKMAMHPDPEDELPYFALIGCGVDPKWSETSVAFTTFYHHLHLGSHVNGCVQAMQSASGNEHFWIEWATNSRQAYLDYINASQLQTAQQNLAKIEAEADQSQRDLAKSPAKQ